MKVLAMMWLVLKILGVAILIALAIGNQNIVIKCNLVALIKIDKKEK